jgi:hypothetical protein
MEILLLRQSVDLIPASISLTEVPLYPDSQGVKELLEGNLKTLMIR